MKVSKRDITALILLLAVGLVYVLYMFLYKPMLADISDSRSLLDQRQASRDSYERMIAAGEAEKLAAQKDEKLALIEEKSAPLLPDVIERKIVAFTDSLAASQEMTVNSASFSVKTLYDTAFTSTSEETEYAIGVLAAEIRDMLGLDPADTGSADVQTEAQDILSVSVNLVFSDVTYDQLTGFIKELEGYERTIYIETISIAAIAAQPELDEFGNVTETGDGVPHLNVSLRFNILAIDKIGDLDTGLDEISPADPSGKTNPFEE